ncbi:MAG: alpha/beta hydrolase [Actinomycetota bacterium]
MPAVFVHGVPDTYRLWDPIRTRLSRDDVIAVALPGFDSEIPEGFDSTKEAYANWLTTEVSKIGEPVDLVGHDWGSLLAARVASLRPDLIRTWAGGAAPIDSTYVWHDTAQLWQTPEVGEQVMEAFTPETAAPGLTASGIPEDAAKDAASHIDDRMKDSILCLYRSAVTVGKEWEGDLHSQTPALLIWGADDPLVPVEFGERLAQKVGGRFVAFTGCGHWWPSQRSEEAAALLEEHWAQ